MPVYETGLRASGPSDRMSASTRNGRSPAWRRSPDQRPTRNPASRADLPGLAARRFSPHPGKRASSATTGTAAPSRLSGDSRRRIGRSFSRHEHRRDSLTDVLPRQPVPAPTRGRGDRHPAGRGALAALRWSGRCDRRGVTLTTPWRPVRWSSVHHEGMALSADRAATRSADARAQVRALDVTDLVKRYPTGTEALRSVSLHIEAGEFFGLLGPNGAGKSTLIHCATGLAQPTSGAIRIFGNDAIEHYAAA